MAPTNALPTHGNEKTMNLNSLILTNILQSPYFKSLYELKTYHQVVDEIFYKVKHLEPWEQGSRKLAGLAGEARGVGHGGIVSSSFCLLYKLNTLKLTRKQLLSICTHKDSPYLRALGLMYIRFTQPPHDFWQWYEPYLHDKEVIDVKAGGGDKITIGDLCVQLLTKLEWYSTLFPRIPVNIQRTIDTNLASHRPVTTGFKRGGGGGFWSGPIKQHPARYYEEKLFEPERSPTPDISLVIEQEKKRISAANTPAQPVTTTGSPHRSRSAHRSRSRDGHRSRSNRKHKSRHRRRHHKTGSRSESSRKHHRRHHQRRKRRRDRSSSSDSSSGSSSESSSAIGAGVGDGVPNTNTTTNVQNNIPFTNNNGASSIQTCNYLGPPINGFNSF